jgi:hypothetical protein
MHRVLKRIVKIESHEMSIKRANPLRVAYNYANSMWPNFKKLILTHEFCARN